MILKEFGACTRSGERTGCKGGCDCMRMAEKGPATDEMTWTREPRDYRIHADRVEISTEPHTDFGREPTIIFAMTMPRCFNGKRMSSFSLLS